MKNIFFFFVQVGAVIVASLFAGGKPSGLIHGNSIALVFGPQLALLILQCGFFGTLSFIKRIINNTDKSEDQNIIDRLSSLGFLQGAIGCVLGLMYALGHLDEGEGLGKGAGFAMSSLIYGAYPAILLLPFNRKPPKVPTGLYTVAVIAGAMTTTLLVLQAFGKH